MAAASTPPQQESGVVYIADAAVFAASSIATLIAMALPWLFRRLGQDPAFGSGPLATVIQDLLSIAVYFAAVTLVAHVNGRLIVAF